MNDTAFPDAADDHMLRTLAFLGHAESRAAEAASRGRGRDGSELAEERLLATELRVSREALRESERCRDELLATLATLAHELRSPLAPIRAAAHIVAAPLATELEKLWSQGVLDRQTQHMARLLDDLLDCSRLSLGKLRLRTETIDLAVVIDTAVDMAHPLIHAKRHHLVIEMPPQPVRCRADPLRLAQVLANLLTNAAKYTDPEGELRLRVACAGEVLTLRVGDNGIGIPAAELESIFGMFAQIHFTEDRSESGLGIGLALARNLVNLHGGTIQARSAGLGQGSEFIVRLPLCLASAAAQPERIPVLGTRTARGRRVLVADDNADAAESLAVFLRLEGHEVAVALDGRQALASIAAMQPDLALLDVAMPLMDGYELARQVRAGQIGGPVRLVALTGWGQAADKAKAFAAGFDLHLTKPVELASLARLLD